ALSAAGRAALVRARRARLSAAGDVPALVPSRVGVSRRPGRADRNPAGPNRARRLLAGLDDELRPRARRGASASRRTERAERLLPPGRSARIRPRAAAAPD